MNDVLQKIEGQFDNVENIRKELFNVLDLPIQSPKEGFEKPNGKIVYTDSGQFLGMVGKDYESLQPNDFLNSLLYSVETCDVNLDLGQLSYKSFADNRMIEFRLPVGKIEFTNKKGNRDETDLYLSFRTGFGGYFRSEIGLYSYRLVCQNGMKGWQTEQALRAKHTARKNQEILDFCNQISEMTERVEGYKEKMVALNDREISNDDVKAFEKRLLGVKDKKDSEISTRKKNQINQLDSAILDEIGYGGQTLWSLLQGVTRYTNHYATNAGEEFIQVATGAKLNEDAQKLVFNA